MIALFPIILFCSFLIGIEYSNQSITDAIKNLTFLFTEKKTIKSWMNWKNLNKRKIFNHC